MEIPATMTDCYLTLPHYGIQHLSVEERQSFLNQYQEFEDEENGYLATAIPGSIDLDELSIKRFADDLVGVSYLSWSDHPCEHDLSLSIFEFDRSEGWIPADEKLPDIQVMEFWNGNAPDIVEKYSDFFDFTYEFIPEEDALVIGLNSYGSEHCYSFFASGETSYIDEEGNTVSTYSGLNDYLKYRPVLSLYLKYSAEAGEFIIKDRQPNNAKRPDPDEVAGRVFDTPVRITDLLDSLDLAAL